VAAATTRGRQPSATESPLTKLELAGAPRGFSPQYVPLALSSLVFAYNVSDALSHARILDLVMTPEQLAKAFTGQPGRWNEAGIPAGNAGPDGAPKYPFPQQLKAVARADRSSVTSALTRFFVGAAKTAYEAVPAYRTAGAADTYPSTGLVDLRTGGTAVATTVRNPTASTPSLRATSASWTPAWPGSPACRPSGSSIRPASPSRVPPRPSSRSSSAPSSNDPCADLTYVGYARDAISWWHSATGPSAAVASLSQQQLKDIYAGTITNWSAVGGTDAPIVVYGVQKSSGTGSVFNGFLGSGIDQYSQIPAANKGSNCDATTGAYTPSFPNCRILSENDASPIFTQGNAANAIYFFSYGRYTQQPDAAGGSAGTASPKGKLGQLDSVTASPETIKDTASTKFPLTRNLFNVVRYPSKAVASWVGPGGVLCTAGGTTRTKLADAIAGTGFVPFDNGVTGGGVSGTSYCRVFRGPVDEQAPVVNSLAFTGKGVATAQFSEPVINITRGTLTLQANGKTVSSAITCLDAAGTTVPCTNGADAPASGVRVSFSPILGATYVVKATSGITDRTPNPLAQAASATGTKVTGSVDGRDRGIAYQGGWSKGATSKSAARGAAASIPFGGTALTWSYAKTGGVATVYVDGVKKAVVTQKNAGRLLVKVPNGLHTFKVVVTKGTVSLSGFKA
jgi:ABC-type phosphate transport system substrate-binding protein